MGCVRGPGVQGRTQVCLRSGGQGQTQEGTFCVGREPSCLSKPPALAAAAVTASGTTKLCL